MIEAKDISVTIGSTKILHNVGFKAQAGAVSVIIGPNGSGKTTLLKALCNDLAYSGNVTINGTDLQRMSAVEAATIRAVLPQSTVLSFPFTVREVVALGLTAGRPGMALDELKTLPERALEKVDLDGFAGRFYQDLSGGEQQRVQLARVLCQVWAPVLEGTPRYLFLDEPVSSLDIKHQLMIMGVARRFADAGGGVIAILHDLNLTAMFGDFVTVLKEGRIVGEGTPKAVMQDSLITHTFECALKVGVLPTGNIPFVLPQSSLL